MFLSNSSSHIVFLCHSIHFQPLRMLFLLHDYLKKPANSVFWNWFGCYIPGENSSFVHMYVPKLLCISHVELLSCGLAIVLKMPL